MKDLTEELLKSLKRKLLRVLLVLILLFKPF
jgi:hypothetical protein